MLRSALRNLRSLLILTWVACAVAKPPAPATQAKPDGGKQTAAVVAANPLAVDAGVEILRKGGSAAAVERGREIA